MSAPRSRPSDYSHDVSPYEYPEDEFDARNDEAHEPIGVHRAPVPAWRSWVPLLAVIVIVPLLAWAAVTLLGKAGYTAPSAQGSASASATAELAGGEEATEATAAAEGEQTAAPQESAAGESEPVQTEEPAAPAVQDADLTTGVTIHNGSSVNGLAGRTADRLANAGYTDVNVQQGVYAGDDDDLLRLGRQRGDCTCDRRGPGDHQRGRVRRGGPVQPHRHRPALGLHGVG